MIRNIFTKNNNRRLVLNIFVRNYSENTETIDARQLSHFRDQVEMWWNPNEKLRGLHTLNKIRIPLIQNGLKKRGLLNSEYENTATPLKGVNILDVGCGGGILCEPLAILGANVTGIDACEDLVECAKIHAQENPALKTPITYIGDVLENHTDRMKDKFDVVLNSECIEHVAAPDALLKSCVEVLRPGGSIFVTTWNKNLLSLFYIILFGEYIYGFIPIGTHEWNKFIPPNHIQKLLEKRNCKIQDIQGISVNMIKNEWSLSSSTKLNYAVHAVKN